MLREIGRKEALKAAADGKTVYVLLQDDVKGTGDLPSGYYHVHTIDEMMENSTFLIDRNAAMINPEFEQAVREMEEQGKNQSVPDTPLTENDKAEEGKRRKVDVGKIMALHNAGWSNVKIADEMSLHPITVGKYIKRYSGAEE